MNRCAPATFPKFFSNLLLCKSPAEKHFWTSHDGALPTPVELADGEGSSDEELDPDVQGSHEALHPAEQHALDAIAFAAEVDAFDGAIDAECFDDAEF